jgi:acyl carrier protein
MAVCQHNKLWMKGIRRMTPITTPEALQMLADLFEVPLQDVTAQTPRAGVVGWDSMGALSLMAELDERFQITLSAESSRSMQRIGDVLALLAQHGALVQ